MRGPGRSAGSCCCTSCYHSAKANFEVRLQTVCLGISTVGSPQDLPNLPGTLREAMEGDQPIQVEGISLRVPYLCKIHGKVIPEGAEVYRTLHPNLDLCFLEGVLE